MIWERWKPSHCPARSGSGFSDAATEPKGFSRYLEVAKEISERFPGQASFSFVGFLAESQTSDSLPNLVYLQDAPTHDKLDRDEYVRRANELHFVCMFYEKEYEFAASGVLADAIEWEKPLIASQLPLFANVERKFPGSAYISERANFGQVIERILTTFDPEYYEKQLQAIRELKHSRTPAVLADTYRLLVTELNGRNGRNGR